MIINNYYNYVKFLERNKEITNLSNFKTKAETKYYFEINNLDDVDKIIDIVRFAKENNLSYKILWAGTNMLFAFNKYKWIIIKNNLSWYNYDENSKLLDVYSNELISNLAELVEKNMIIKYGIDL